MFEAPGDFHMKNPDSMSVGWGDKEMCMCVTPKLRLSSLNDHSSQKGYINKK